MSHPPSLKDRFLFPGDERFEKAVAGFNTAYEHSVGAVLVARESADVVEAVRYARDLGWKVVVQATGHGVHAPIVADLMISTRALGEVAIDGKTGVATVGAGVLSRDLYAAAALHELAPVLGSAPTVGVVGYLLGGGLGPLARSHGFGSDYLEELTVVSGQGEVLRANAAENPDLFWALRGGKCGLGLVIGARLRLVALPELVAGRLDFEDGDHLEKVLRGWLEWTPAASDQATTSLAFARRGGEKFLSLRVACSRPVGPGELAPLRQLAPCRDGVEIARPEFLGNFHEDPEEPFAFWVSGLMLGELDSGFATTLLAQFEDHSALVGFELRHLGGSTERDVPEGSAVGGRAAKFAAAFIWRPQRDLFETAHPQSEARLRESLSPWLFEGTNINFTARVRDRAHFDSAWPAEIRNRLEAVRKRYDPDGMFALKV